MDGKNPFGVQEPNEPAELQRPVYVSTPPSEKMVPYRNPKALAAYYLGIVSGLPLIGLPLGVAALVLGIQGLRQRKEDPSVYGTAHAWIGIGCGGFFAVLWSIFACGDDRGHPHGLVPRLHGSPLMMLEATCLQAVCETSSSAWSNQLDGSEVRLVGRLAKARENRHRWPSSTCRRNRTCRYKQRGPGQGYCRGFEANGPATRSCHSHAVPERDRIDVPNKVSVRAAGPSEVRPNSLRARTDAARFRTKACSAG